MFRRLTTRLFLKPVCLVSLSTMAFFGVANVDGQDPPFKPMPLNVPAGYTVEVAAAPPLVTHPLMACFDDRGRLYVAANCGENLPRAELEKRLPNFVQQLTDLNQDGVFDRVTTFADRMTFPQGCLWLDGSLFVASSGAIWKLTDTDDDGVADDRQKLVGDFGYTGNAADVHGPFLGPEGRIYWCEGRHGHEIRDGDGTLISQGKAARIFSCRSDGSDVQTYCTGGMDNPVEIVFTPEGEMLGTVNLMHARPRGDCLVHWQYGGVYPRHDFAAGLNAEFVLTGDLLPEVHDFGHVAVSGLCRAAGNALGPNCDGALFVTQFNTNRVVRVSLKPNESTFAVDRMEDFAVSTNNDFRPTDVLQDADGSLLVIDTGGWFRIGCPQSQVAKSHIRGAIYRIRPPAQQTIEIPSNSAAATREKRLREIAALRDAATAESLEKLASLVRSDGNGIGQAAARALLHVEVANEKVASQIASRLGEMARIGDPAERRVAASVLADWAKRDPTLQPWLVDALRRDDNDRLIQHALILGLIHCGDRQSLSRLVNDPQETVRRAAAIALEQLRRPEVTSANPNWLEIPAPSLGKPLTDDDRRHLLAVEAELPSGNVEHGREVFLDAKSTCSKCHRVSGTGGQVGPDLTTIGRSRSHRDLLEAILFPSASFVRGFAPYVVATDDGQIASGIILSESLSEIRLGIDKEKATWIANESIEQIRAADTSIMPQGLDKLLSHQELADLLAYLESLPSK